MRSLDLTASGGYIDIYADAFVDGRRRGWQRGEYREAVSRRRGTQADGVLRGKEVCLPMLVTQLLMGCVYADCGSPCVRA